MAKSSLAIVVGRDKWETNRVKTTAFRYQYWPTHTETFTLFFLCLEGTYASSRSICDHLSIVVEQYLLSIVVGRDKRERSCVENYCVRPISFGQHY